MAANTFSSMFVLQIGEGVLESLGRARKDPSGKPQKLLTGSVDYTGLDRNGTRQLPLLTDRFKWERLQND